MTSSRRDRDHTNNVSCKVLVCYICGKSVKDDRLTSHLLFGSLQCSDCNLKFRYCRDFYSFRKSRHEQKRRACVHRGLKWTRDPAEYLQRKLRQEIAKEKSGKHEPSTKEVTKALVSYVQKLKPIELRSPWKFAVEKLKVFTSLNSNVSCCDENDRNEHLHEKISHRKESINGISKKEHNNLNEDQSVEIAREIGIKEVDLCNIDPADEKCSPGDYIFHTESLTDYVDANRVSSVESAVENPSQTYYEILNAQEYNGEAEVPHYAEEITISNEAWESENSPFRELENCNDSVELYLTDGEDEGSPLLLEEVVNSKEEKSDLITLFIADNNFENSESGLLLYNSKPSFAELPENSIESVVEVCTDSHYEISVENTFERCTGSEEEMNKNNYGFQKKNCQKDKANECEETTKQSICIDGKPFLLCSESSSNIGKLPLQKSLCDTPQYKVLDGAQTSRDFCRVQGNLHTRDDINNGYIRNVYKKKRCSNALKKLQMQSVRVYGKSRQHHKFLSDKLEGKTYNLRSRKPPLSNSILQHLSYVKKRQLWKKILPIANRLQKLTTLDNNESFSNLVPFFTGENDHDFVVDIVLSWALETNEFIYDISSSSSSITTSDDNDDDDDDEDVTMSYDEDPRGVYETACLRKKVENILRQFSGSEEKTNRGGNVISSKSKFSKGVNGVKERNNELVAKRKGKKGIIQKCLDGKANYNGVRNRQKKIFFVKPPSDGRYYVVSYPSQSLIKECPMCYYRVFPAMFSLNLVTNLATARCVGCMLTIYVVQEPDETNSFPEIVFKREESSEDDQNVAKRGRYGRRSKTKLQRNIPIRCAIRSFFKQ